jgi:acyl-CoA synthetase (AMP-forming)/AMP-acid ligase II
MLASMTAPFGISELAAKADALALDDFERRRTFAELSDRARRVAGALRASGVEPGAHVAIWMANRVEYVEVVLGAVLAGVYVTPLNYHLADDEVRYVLEDAGAAVLFADAAHAERARACAAPRTIEVGPGYEAFLASAAPLAGYENDPPGAPMIYTSGTSGRPKGVKRRRAATVAEQLARYREAGLAFGLDGAGPHLVTGPLYHAAPLLFAVYDLLRGATVYVMPRFDAARTLELLASTRAAHVHLVPTMIVRMLRLPQAQREAFDGSALALVLHGAAPIAPEVKRAAIAWWGPKLVEYWGATEGGIYTRVESAAWLERPGTVGRPVGRFEVFAADDQGRRLPPGEIGTLFVRHPDDARPFVYHGDEAKTEAAYLPSGAFTAGDLGHVDADGFVYLSERRSNLVLSGGVNIYPAEVERVLGAHEAVADVAAFGVPDPEWGEALHAAVELAAGHVASPELESELRAYVRARLAPFKVPRRIHFEARLPRLPTGKLYVRRLRAKYGAR